MYRFVLISCLLSASIAAAQSLPLGRVLVEDGVSAALVPVQPLPALPGLPTVPEQFMIYGIMIDVSTMDATVSGYQIAMRVETASGARIDFSSNLNRDPQRTWSNQIFYTGKDPVTQVLSLTIIPLQPNQVRTFRQTSANY